MSIRNLFFDALAADGGLNGYGIDSDTLYPAQAPDSPLEKVFAVLRWGSSGIGVGPARHVSLAFWVYHKDPDYAIIDTILKRARVVLPTLVTASIAGGGYVLGVEWQESSEDLTATEYGANTVVRNETYRITASGI